MAKSPTPTKKPSAAAKSAASHSGHGHAQPSPKDAAKNAAKHPAKSAVAAGSKAKSKPEKPVAPAKAKGKPEKAAVAAIKAPAPAPAKEKEKKSRGDLSPKILHLIAEEMAIEEAELTPAASFKEDLGLDEIDVAELLMQAEMAFAVHTFNEEDWEGCETVGDLIELIEKRVAAKRGKKPAAQEAKGKNAKA